MMRPAAEEEAQAALLPTPDHVSFNTVITALGHAHKPDKAEAILTSMLDLGYAPSLVTFTSVISAYAKASRPADAARVMERLLSAAANHPGLVPDVQAFNV